MRYFHKKLNKQVVSYLVIAFSVGILGMGLLLSTHASTPIGSLEAENGTVTGGASQVSSTAASGGNAVKFQAAAAGPQSCPAYPAFPDASCTGVPPSFTCPGVSGTQTTLTVVNGDLSTSSDGQVICGKDIKGAIIVGDDNVTVMNSKIADRIDYRSESGATLTIQDSEIGSAICPGSPNGANPNDYPLIYFSGWYKLLRVHMHGDEDLVRTSFGHTIIQDSFLDHTCFYVGAHADAAQQYSPGDVSNVTFIHNTINGQTANSSDKGNSAIFWSDHPGAGSTLTVYNNLLIGGNFSLWTTDAPAGSGVTIDVHDNQFLRNSYNFGPHNCDNSVHFNGTEGVKWANNTYSDNGQQISTACP